MRVRLTLAVISIAACSGGGTQEAVSAEIVAPDGFEVAVVATGFDGPTQMAIDDDGHLIVAELNGGEADGTGRVVSVDLDDPGDRTVLVDGLLTPTGVAVDGDRLWIMEQRTLTVGPIDGRGQRSVVEADLAFNGRSQGTLTTLDDGGVLYNTSGGEAGADLIDGSGVLWRVDSSGQSTSVAIGIKHGYAHVESADGRLFVTEITDRPLDGGPPPDELMVVRDGDDFGYPRCIGDRVAVEELGATDAECALTPPSHALFEPGSTPTSVVVAPWDANTLLVALWNSGTVVTVPATAGPTPHTGTLFVSGIEHPQHLLVVGDRLLISDHASGNIIAVSRTD